MQGSKRDENRILRMKRKKNVLLLLCGLFSHPRDALREKKTSTMEFFHFSPNFFFHCLFRECEEYETKLNLIRTRKRERESGVHVDFFKFSIPSHMHAFMCSYALSSPFQTQSWFFSLVFFSENTKICPLLSNIFFVFFSYPHIHLFSLFSLFLLINV